MKLGDSSEILRFDSVANHMNHEEQSQESAIQLTEASRSDRESLLDAMAELDLAFSKDRALDLSNIFAEDARLMWPQMEDIVGRESIREAFVSLMSKYTTVSWNPKREFIEVYERRAYSLGGFVETRTPRDGGPTEKIYGRLLEIWQLSYDGKWEVIRMMTGRYSKTELLE
jgi:ketosteroid isomerase-like protein